MKDRRMLRSNRLMILFILGAVAVWTLASLLIGGTSAILTDEVQSAAIEFSAASWSLPLLSPPGAGCTHRLSYWMTHISEWPVKQLVLDGKTVTRGAIIIRYYVNPVQSARDVLQAQLVAARLNLLNGALSAAAEQISQDVELFLEEHPSGQTLDAESQRQAFIMALALEQYNLGQAGPKQCESEESLPATLTPRLPGVTLPVTAIVKLPASPTLRPPLRKTLPPVPSSTPTPPGPAETTTPQPVLTPTVAARVKLTASPQVGAFPRARLTPPAVVSATPEGENCTYTIDTWLAWPDEWPVEALRLGRKKYKVQDLVTLLQGLDVEELPSRLTLQVVAARLNLLNGADPAAVQQDLQQAELWLLKHPLGSKPKAAVAKKGAAFADALGRYNAGKDGPGICRKGLATPTPTPTPRNTPTPLPSPAARSGTSVPRAIPSLTPARPTPLPPAPDL